MEKSCKGIEGERIAAAVGKRRQFLGLLDRQSRIFYTPVHMARALSGTNQCLSTEQGM